MDDIKFIKHFENKVINSINKYNLFSKKDKILVAASGGKDSTSLLYLLKKLKYNVSALTINSHIGCYSDENLSKLRKFCSENKIKLYEISLRKEFGNSLCNIIAILNEKGIKKTSCSVCGALRRYLLNKFSKKLGFKVILTGHNLDDEVNGILTSLFSGKLNHAIRTSPLIKNKNFVVKAKPFYLCFEDEIERYSKIKKFDVHYGWCPCSESGMRRFFSELNLSDEIKMNIINNLMKTNKKLIDCFKDKQKLKKCSNCNEPSSNELCQTCSILSIVKNNNKL